MVYEFELATIKECMKNITKEVKEAVQKSGVANGICVVYSPHTTAGITINENADPDVVKDVLFGLNKTFCNHAEFKHSEGNSSAHLKTSCVGVSQSIIISKEKLLLGVWQGIYFCEFDGPRNRKFYVKVLKDSTMF